MVQTPSQPNLTQLSLSSSFPDSAPSANPVFYRTYSRKTPTGRESWRQVCDRTLAGLIRLGHLTPSEAKLLDTRQRSLQSLSSGRWLWIGGTPWIDNPQNFSGGYNCTSTNVVDWHAFGLMMDLAMMGCGTGAVLETHYIEKLPPIHNTLTISLTDSIGTVPDDQRRDETIVTVTGQSVTIEVGDSRRGWVDSYQAILELAADTQFSGSVDVQVSLAHVRPAGEALNGFGGVANPVKLPELYDRCARILNKAKGRQLTSVECCLLIDEAAIVVVAGNVRRCLPEDALVHTSQGLVPIKDVQIGDLVQTPIGFRKVLDKFDQGVQDIYEIETNSTTPRATANHRIAVMKDAVGGILWKRVGDLEEGDRLLHNTQVLPGTVTSLPLDNTAQRPAHSRTAQDITIPALTPDVAWLIGFTHGDGYVSLGRNKHNKPYGCVSWSMNGTQPELAQRITDRINRVLSLFGGLSAPKSSVKGENTITCRCSSIRLAEYFHQYIKRPHDPITVPTFILQGSVDIRAAYLAGIMDSDGAINNRPPHLVTTIYPGFARQVAAVLSSLGIAGRLSVTRPNENHWQVKHNVTIPALKGGYNAIIAPHSLKGTIRQGLKMYGFTIPGSMMRETYAYGEMRAMGFQGNRAVDSNFERYRDHSEVEIDIPVTVRGIGSYDSIQTYDIEVEEAHCFYCDGYLTHNSAGMRQFSSDDELAAVAKENLWQQDEKGNWRIDPERDSLRMANHTRVYHHKPTLEEITAAVRKQFYSGEGAIQYAPEAIARANIDLLSSPDLKQEFLEVYTSLGRDEARNWLNTNYPTLSEVELDDRLSRYGLNPCFRGDMKLLTTEGYKTFKDLDGQEVMIINAEGNQSLGKVWKSGEKPVIKLTLSTGDPIFCTEDHRWMTAQGEEMEARNLIGHRLMPYGQDANDPSQTEIGIVQNIEPAGVSAVYDFSEPLTHWGVVNGFVAHNCGEIIMANNHCNLAEIHLNQIDPKDTQAQQEAFQAGALSVATLLNHNFTEARYQQSRKLDPIVGVSFTGLFDFCVHAFGVDWLHWWTAGRPDTPQGQQFKAQEKAYLETWRDIVHHTVWDYCDRHHIPKPNRCTTVQPSGTKSLLTGASPGWHPPKAQRFLRRITFRKNDPVALACMDYGYSVIPSQSDKDEQGNLLDNPFDPRCTEWLVEIPTAVTWADVPGADRVDISQFSAQAQFDFYMQVQQHYTTHNTSATIELREPEIESLAQAIYQTIDQDQGYISAALLARFDDLQTFPRLPFEPISKEEYDRLTAAVRERRTIDDFFTALQNHDQGLGEIEEAGPAGCDSDKCLLPDPKA